MVLKTEHYMQDVSSTTVSPFPNISTLVFQIYTDQNYPWVLEFSV
jgi:hypothetical protein